ncbi:MAG: hypothetical protein MRZ90_07465 [Candidatus Gastranaerophilales bacterium]|nr:hypothetical protein [Candidatus Gastranaerophilales bacterium]
MVTSSVIENQVNFIQQLIRNNEKFIGNEELFEEFTSEAYSKLQVFINTIKDLTKIEGYASKIVNTSILSVLKRKGRLSRVNSNLSVHKTIPFDVSNINDVIKNSDLKYEDKIMYELIDPKFSYIQPVENKELLQSIVKSVIDINKDYPEEQYLKLYKLRYVNKKTQNQISFELNIAQNEVAKRLLELGNLIKLYINQTI